MPRYPTTPPRNAAQGGVDAVDRAVLLLAAFRAGDAQLPLGDLVARTGLVKSTVLRLLASLTHSRLLDRTPDGRYRLGSEIGRLGVLYNAAFSLEAIVMPVLERLVERTRESAAYHVRQGRKRLSLLRVNSPLPVRYHVEVGELLPLDRGAGGRVLSAFSGAKGAIYDEIRREGFVAIVGDRAPDLAGISAPVFDAEGVIAGAVTLTMPASRFNRKFVTPVREAARSLRGIARS